MSELITSATLPRCGFQTGASLADACGQPAFYAFEIDRGHWEKEDSRVPTHAPLVGYACILHGGEARKMPAVSNVRTIR